MEFAMILVVAMLFVTPTTQALSIPGNSSALFSLSRTFSGDTGILVTLLIIPRVHNATMQMTLLYPFITSSNYLQQPLITLGLDLNKVCTKNQQMQEKLAILHSQIAVFMDPLHFAFLFENGQGSGHRRLTSVLEMTSYYLNETVSYIKRQMVRKGVPIPGYTTIPEFKLDERSRVYLTTLVQNNVVTLTVTDDVVKAYRNYVIMFTLQDVINELGPCM